MLEDFIIVGITMAVVQFVIKRLVWATKWDDEDKSRIVGLSVLVLAGLLNVGNAALFAPGSDLIAAFGDGVRMGALAGGIYSIGKAVLGQQ